MWGGNRQWRDQGAPRKLHLFLFLVPSQLMNHRLWNKKGRDVSYVSLGAPRSLSAVASRLIIRSPLTTVNCQFLGPPLVELTCREGDLVDDEGPRHSLPDDCYLSHHQQLLLRAHYSGCCW